MNQVRNIEMLEKTNKQRTQAQEMMIYSGLTFQAYSTTLTFH